MRWETARGGTRTKGKLRMKIKKKGTKEQRRESKQASRSKGSRNVKRTRIISPPIHSSIVTWFLINILFSILTFFLVSYSVHQLNLIFSAVSFSSTYFFFTIPPSSFFQSVSELSLRCHYLHASYWLPLHYLQTPSSLSLCHSLSPFTTQFIFVSILLSRDKGRVWWQQGEKYMWSDEKTHEGDLSM